MKSKRHSPEQVIRKLSEGDKLLNEGATVAEVARQQLRARRDLAVKVEDVGRAVCLWCDIDCVSTVELVQSG